MPLYVLIVEVNVYLFLIAVPCIVISMEFLHQQMHSILELIKF